MPDNLQQRFGSRLRPILLTGDEKTDKENMIKASPDPIDVELDILPPSVTASTVRTVIMTVRPGGTIVPMGGVDMLGGIDLNLPYPWIMRNNITIKGQWMYEPEAVYKLIALAKSGLLRLEDYEITSFGLNDANEAIEFAANNAGAFKLTIINA